ncbi:MAG: hypothetical protein ABIL06_26060 [Pseudomonadota bacterium]
MVKKVLVMATALIILPSLLFAEAGSKKWGVGVNYPGLSLKCMLNAKQTIELKAQFGKDIFVVGPRYYHNFRQKGKVNLFFGGEGNYLTFKGAISEGSGFAVGAFVGGEYFTTPNLGVSLDIGPAYISLKDKDTDKDEGGLDFVTNLGLTYYFGGGR